MSNWKDNEIQELLVIRADDSVNVVQTKTHDFHSGIDTFLPPACSGAKRHLNKVWFRLKMCESYKKQIRNNILYYHNN